jgi:hypothetical protein
VPAAGKPASLFTKRFPPRLVKQRFVLCGRGPAERSPDFIWLAVETGLPELVSFEVEVPTSPLPRRFFRLRW